MLSYQGICDAGASAGDLGNGPRTPVGGDTSKDFIPAILRCTIVHCALAEQLLCAIHTTILTTILLLVLSMKSATS
jgi:hypothetical protein